MHTHKIYGATSIFPGRTFKDSITGIANGVEEYFGKISIKHVQLCPQNRGYLSRSLCDELTDAFPETTFRLHANVRVETKLKIFDLSSVGKEANNYFRTLANYSKYLGAPLYSLHAGYRENCSRDALVNRIKQLEQWFEVDVAIEGGYLGSKRALHLSTWDDHKWLLDQELAFVIDLSHLNIIRSKLGKNDALVKSLLDSPFCREVHISSNNGTKDSHLPVCGHEWWTDLLQSAKSIQSGQAQVFSEGNQLLLRRHAKGGE